MIISSSELPKSVSPDSIKDAVVELRYGSNLPYEILLGLIFESLDPSYTYINRPHQQPLVNSYQDMMWRNVDKRFFYTDEINIQVKPGSFLFTYKESYLGWERYSKAIYRTLEQINKVRADFFWTQIGLRYINHYPNKELKDIVKFNFTFGLPEIESVKTVFKSEFQYKNSKIILNLRSNAEVPHEAHNKSSEIVLASFVDIDVLTFIDGEVDTTTLFEIIDGNHDKEKELFFSMLKPEFLSTLNPVY